MKDARKVYSTFFCMKWKNICTALIVDLYFPQLKKTAVTLDKAYRYLSELSPVEGASIHLPPIATLGTLSFTAIKISVVLPGLLCILHSNTASQKADNSADRYYSFCPKASVLQQFYLYHW